MAEWVIKYWMAWAFGLVIAAGGCLCRWFKRRRNIELGLRALLRDRMCQIYDNCTDKGFCPRYTKESIEEMYAQYHALGGNGYITEIYGELMKMSDKPQGEK